MSSSGKKRSASDFNSVVEFMNEHKTGIVDNLSRDESFAEEHCSKEKARLLINANCTKDSFFGYMSSGERKGDFNVFKGESLKIIIEDSNFVCKDDITKISSSHFSCYTGSFNSEPVIEKIGTLPPCNELLADTQRFVRFCPYELVTTHTNKHGKEYSCNSLYEQKNKEEKEIPIFANWWARVLFDFFNQNDELSLCDASQNAAATCRYFNNSCNPYDKIEKLESAIIQEYCRDNLSKMPAFPCVVKNSEPNYFPPGINALGDLQSDSQKQIEFTASDLNEYLERILTTPMARYYALLPQHEARFTTSKLVYSFKNEYGQTMMKVVKCFSDINQNICMLPITCWRYRSCYYHQLYALPWASGKQPLYNLDLLMNDFYEEKFVVLTDNIEIADYMQENCQYDNVVFTSFICQPGRYDQVDWSPLRTVLPRQKDVANEEAYDTNVEDKVVDEVEVTPRVINLAYLIANHSGKALEEQYYQAQKLVTYLEKNEKITVNHFLERDVDYDQDIEVIESINDLLSLENCGKTTETGTVPVSREQFDATCEEAQKRLMPKPVTRFSARNIQTASQNPQEKLVEEKEEATPPSFIFFPIISRGDITSLVGFQKSKKSMIATIIAMIATNANNQKVKSLFEEVLWKTTKADKPSYPGHKVLYLDFENGKEEMINRLSHFAKYYWPNEPEKRKQCRENLILEYPQKINYSDLKNLNIIFKMIKEAEDKGTTGQEVDLLVIDSFDKFNGDKTDFKNTIEIRRALDAFRAKFPKMAVLMSIHKSSSAESGKEAASRGDSSGFDNIQYEVVITKQNEVNKGKDIEEDDDELIRIQLTKERKKYATPRTREFIGVLPIIADKNYFQVYGRTFDQPFSNDDKSKERTEFYTENLHKLHYQIVKVFKQKVSTFADILGVTENTLRDHMKK